MISLRTLPEALIDQCDTEQAAMRLCIAQSSVHRTHDVLADILSVQRAQFNQILNSDRQSRPKYASRDFQVRLQVLCGNRAIDQWASLRERELLTEDRPRARVVALVGGSI